MKTYRVPSSMMNQLYAFALETVREDKDREVLFHNVGSKWTKEGRLFLVRVLGYSSESEKIHSLCQQAEKGKLRLPFSASASSEHRYCQSDKVNLNVTLLSVVSYYGYYGFTTFYRFKDSDGNIYEWYTSSSQEYTRGEYVLSGRVKSNDVHDNVKVTTLNCVSLRKKENNGND